MNDDLWDKVRGLGSETWKGCERVNNILNSSAVLVLFEKMFSRFIDNAEYVA